MRAIGWILVFGSLSSHAADGLRMPSADTDLRWQARAQGWAQSLALPQSPRLSTPHWLGDYYVSADGQGLRVSGGLMGTASSSGSAPSERPYRFNIATPQPYLGLGFSQSGLGWGVSADLGFTVRAPGLTPRNPESFAPGLDIALRGLQLQPMVQMGLFYRF